MRLNNKKVIISIVCITLQLCGYSFKSFAHDLWIEASNFTPDPGQDVRIKLAYDHIFPAKDLMEDKNLKEIYMLDPGSKRIDIKKLSETEYEAVKPLKEKGAYLIVSAQKARFWTKTTEGYKSDQSKKGLKNVISCTNSLKFGKGIINSGKGEDKAIAKPIGHDLEIIPLVNPAAMHPGDALSIKILFKGKPLASSYVYATYMGFSEEKDTYAYTTKTNAEGDAKIKMLKQGIWLIATSSNEDYQDKNECDINKYSSTLTFEIK